MDGPFFCFPYSKKTWVLSINQLSEVHLASDAIFSGKINASNITPRDLINVEQLIIGTGVNEYNTFGNHTEYLQKTIENCNKIFYRLKKIFIFYTNVYFDSNLLKSNSELEVIHVPYFLIRSSLTNTTSFAKWTAGDKKAMCLVGDIRNRPHKFSLLYYFFTKGTLDLLNYTLVDDIKLSKRWCTDYLNEWNNSQTLDQLNSVFNTSYTWIDFINLYRSLIKEFENDKIEGGLDSSTHCFPKEWNSSCCNLVLETSFFGLMHDNHKKKYHVQKYQPKEFFFSEKIWKPLLGNKPFITISEDDLIYHQLEELGFKTFLNYTDYPEKINYPINTDKPNIIIDYLDVCYSRVASFLKNVDLNKEKIGQDVEFNKNRWKELHKSVWKDIIQRCPPIKYMSRNEFCGLFTHYPKFELFQNWNTKRY